jgi:1,4-dihydroxy-2-naphthoate octaprenyltransferase
MRMTDLSLAIGATRPRFLTVSLLPVLIGTGWGWRAAGRLDLPDLALALLATLLVHAASNVYNDISDEELGTDRANTTRIPPFTGGSRFIQDGLMDLTEMRRLAGILALLAFGAGAALALREGPGVLAFGAAGASLGFAYSLPGVRLSGLGLGEAAIGIAFGVLPVTGAAWLPASTPAGCWPGPVCSSPGGSG